jgi:ABC-2 type transport system permease protein
VSRDNSRMLQKAAAYARVSFGITMEYRAQILIWMMSSVLMLIMMTVWVGISRDGAVAGFSERDFIAYYMIGWFVRTITAVWASWELDFAIREGRLSPLLLKPIHPIVNEIVANWSEKALRLVVVAPVVIAVLWFTGAAPAQLTPFNLLAFIVALLGAWVVVFLSDYLIGMLAFWTSQTSAFIAIFYGLRMLLSGIIAPLALFPAWVREPLYWSPFPYMLNFPTLILTQGLSSADLLSGFALQAFWALIFAAAVRIVWKLAMRSYSAVGA